MAVQINVAANQAALTASIQAGVQAYNQKFAQNNPINLSINQRAFSQPLGRMTGDVKDFEAALAASNARVIAFGASTAVLGGVIRSFKELANVTIDVEKNLADINRVFGLTTSQLQKFSTDLFSVGKQTASSFDDASKAALEFSRQGLKAEEVLIRTKDALTLARVAGISTANSVDALTSTVNGFAVTGVTTTQILNKLVAVEQDFAVGAGDLAEALSRTGQAAQEAGVSLDQLNALVTAAQQSTARGGAVIGNALKTIFTRLQRTETLDQLEAFNIAVRDVQGNTLPAVTVLQNFAGAYKNLGDAQRAQLSEQVAGVYQVNILKAIVGDLNKSQGVYAGALQRGASATNEAEVATAKLNQTLDALLKQTATSTQQLANNIGKVTFEPLARYGTEQLKSLVESMNEILEGEGIGSTFANGLLKGIRNIIAGPGAIAAFFTLFKLIQNSFTYLAQALPQIAGITTETQNRKNIEQSILQIMQQQGPVSQALAGSMGNQAAQAQLLLQLARQQTAEYQIQSTLAKQLATQLAGQGVRVKGSGGLQVTRAGGYIPAATKIAEAVGAQAGGYAPGKIVKSPVGGVMNTAEDVKYVPGFAQPFINPPAGSKAGRAHRQNAISRTGVDPYMNDGFIPNFVLAKENAITFASKNKIINTKADWFDSFMANINPIELDKTINDYRKQAYDIVDNVYVKTAQRKATGNASPYNRDALASFIKQYKNKVDSSTLKRTATALKNPDEWMYAQNQVQGLLGEVDAKNLFKNSSSTKKNDYFDLIKEDGSLAEVRTRSNISKKDILKKAILERLKNKNYRNNDNESIDLGSYDVVIPKGSSFSSNGFIPNFATPVDSARIPWFKKYASSYKNTASDKDIFRQIDFPTYGKGLDHSYAKIGNPDMVSFLYEDFVRSAMNIALGSKQVVRSKEAGFKNTPTNAISNRDPIDLAQKISGVKFRMLEVKQSKNNQKETISQISDAKLRGLFEENPELAKNVELMSIIFNDPRYVDPTGKNPAGILSPFEQSIAPIVKNSYADVDSTMRGKLGLLTDGLMKRYQSKKNSFSKGFIPNFNYNDIGLDALTRKLGQEGAISQDLTQFVIDLKNQKYAMGDGFHREIIAKNFGEIVTDEELSNPKNANTYLKGSYDKNSGKTIFYKSFAQSMLPGKLFESKHPYIQTVQNELKSRFAKRQASAPVKQKKEPPSQIFRNQYPDPSLVNHFNNGLIPNFADPEIKINSGKEAVESFYRKGSEVDGKKLTGGVMAFPVPQTTDLYSVGSSRVSIPGSGFGIPLYDAVLAEVSKKGAWLTSDRKTVSAQARRIWDGYRKLRTGDVNNKQLPIKNWFLDPAFNNGSDILPTTNPQDLLKNKSTWPSENDPVWSLQHAYQFKKSQLNDKMSSGFIPNSAGIIDVEALGKNSVTYSGDLMKLIKDIESSIGRHLTSGELRFLTNPKTNLSKLNDPKVLNKFINSESKGGFAQFAKGFIPNFAYKQAVMGLEESMSGNKAVFDTKPFPHIRNKSQPTFSSAIADHGGLGNALSDSMRGQKDAGLMSGGFMPNFATVKSKDAFGLSSKVLPDVDRKEFVEMNRALKKLAKDLTLTAEQQNVLKAHIIQSAKVLQLNTGSTNIVTLANTALQKSITQNATAQALLAQKADEAKALLEQKNRHEAKAITQAKKTRRQNLKQLPSEQRERLIKQELANDPETAARYQKRFGPKGGSLEEQIGGAVGGFAGRRTGTRINQSVKALSGVGFQLAAPMIGGMLEQIVSRGRGRQDMSVSERFASSAPSSILTGLSTGAFVGTALGGPGIGTAVGAIVGLGQAALSAQDSISDIAGAAESYRGASTQTVEGAKSYIDQLSQIGSIKDESLLNQATYKLSETFQKLSESSPELARKFNEASGDVGKMQEAIQEFTKEASLISGIKSLSSSYKKQERPFVEFTATRNNELKKKGYDVNERTGNIEKVTEANLQTSFVQFQGFFDMLKQSGLDENQTKSFAKDYQKELQAGVTGETALTNIGLKNGMSKKVAEEFAVLGDNRIQEMGTEGTFFIDNMQEITQRYFDKTQQNFKTTIDKSKAIQFNSRELLLNLRKGIEDYIFNASMQIQEKEFDSARLDVLDSAIGEFIDKITSPLEAAGRQAQVKLRQTAMSQQNERTRLSSDVINTSGKQIFERLGGGDADVIEKTLKPILANLQNPETQQQALEDLITKTASYKNATAAGFKGEPEKIAEFNAQLIQQLKSTVLLSAKQKQQLTLVELEIKMSQRRAESTQALIELEGKLINRELERNKVLNSSSAGRQIETAREKANSEKAAFGFGLSPSQINNKKATIDQNALDRTQLTSREAIFAPGKDLLEKELLTIKQNLEDAQQTQLDKLSISRDLDAELPDYDRASAALSKLSTINIPDFKNLDEFERKLKEVRSVTEGVVRGNNDINKGLITQLGIIDKLKNDQEVEQETLKANLSVGEQAAKQLGKANELYNDRLRIVLETANAEQNFRNSLEIDSQRIDAFKSRDANFYGLDVTGKANLEIQKNNENLGINQQQTRLNSLTKARGSLNEFAMYRGSIDNLTGPLTENQQTAKNAISNINPKINNLEDAKRVADELETARKLLNSQSDEAKKLADFEFQIRQTLQDNTSELDKQQKLQDILNGKVRQEAKDRQSIRMGFKEGFDQIQEDADTGLNKLAKDTPILFRDGMVDAIKATIRETDNLDAALMGVASKFLDTFSTQLMNTGISKIISGSGLGSVFGAQTGGYIRAQSGMYISGTGTGDKYPAMLENGEYVLNRRAVMAMGGPAALDTLNFSAAPRFASGGAFKKEFNDISSMENNMTQMGLENDPYYNELTDAAKQKAQQDRAKKLADKQQRAAMIGSLVAAAATVAIGAGMSNMASNAKATKAEGLAAKAQGPVNLTKSEIKAYEGFQKSGMINSYGEYAGPQAQTGFRSFTSKPFYSSNIYGPNPYAPAFKKNGRQTGGLIGSRLSDTIPGYMEGGLYDSPMVKRYGTGMQSGSSPISSAGNSNSTVNNNTSANNSFNFNTSVQRDGSLKMGSNTTSYEQQDVELSKNLNNKIYAAVGEVIRKEKQFGGSLAGVRNS